MAQEKLHLKQLEDRLVITDLTLMTTLKDLEQARELLEKQTLLLKESQKEVLTLR